MSLTDKPAGASRLPVFVLTGFLDNDDFSPNEGAGKLIKSDQAEIGEAIAGRVL